MEIGRQLHVAAATGCLKRIAAVHDNAALASSFGLEDMVLTDLIVRHSLPIAVFTLDTGRLPGETYALIDRVRDHYGIDVELYSPEPRSLEGYVREHGINAFYRSVELRLRCCAIRKTEPLARALVSHDAWITGQRRSQSVTRTALAVEEIDTVHHLPKFNPLADWTLEQVWEYVHARSVPYNPLHDRGYPSIGCAPCTRAIEPGEDLRAGRWWWEQSEHKECGLHRRPLDIAVRVERVEIPS